MMKRIFYSGSRYRPILIVIFLAALLRILWVAFSPALLFQDFIDYERLGYSLFSGHGYTGTLGPTAFRPPGYPFLIYLIYSVFGRSLLAVKLINVLMGVVTAAASYLLAKAIFSNDRIAFITGLLVAATPSLTMYSAILASENLATVMFVVAITLVLYGLRQSKWIFFCLAGGLIGIASLTRTVFLLFPAVIFIFILVRYKSVKKSVLPVSAILITMLLTLSPWVIRNYVVFQRLIPVSTNGGFNLLMSFNEETTGKYEALVIKDVFNTDFDWASYHLVGLQLSEVDIDRASAQAAFKFITENPVQSLLLAGPKLWNLLRDDVSGVYENFANPARNYPHWVYIPLQAIAQLYYLALLATMIFAFVNFRELSRYPDALLPFLFLLYLLAIHSIFIGGDRFHLPFLPIVAVFSAWGCERLLNIGHSGLQNRTTFSKPGLPLP